MAASLYTPELQGLICERIVKGDPPHVAARICGVKKSTHYSWLQKGRAGEDPWVDYLEAIEKAQAEAEAELVKSIREAAVSGYSVERTKTVIKPDGTKVITTTKENRRFWQAAAWILERTHSGYDKGSLEDAIKVIAKAILSGDEKAAKELRLALAIPDPDLD